MQEITITKPDDFHNHLRQGELMSHLVTETSKTFARTLVMPNTLPPVISPEGIQTYRSELEAVGTDLDFLMTFKIMSSMSPESIAELKRAGAVAGKLYPQGVTTHSEDGIADIKDLYLVFEAMQESDLVLCIHGEVPGIEDLKREEAFLPTLADIVSNFPKLRIVLEHTSSKAAVEMVQEFPETVAATLTVHHLVLTEKDVRNGQFHPHHFCAPICKSEGDRKALIEAALSGNPRFFFGSDSAPHLLEHKQGDHPKPGVYTTPVALPILLNIYEKNEKLDKIEPFTSHFGADFYKTPRNTQKVSFQKQSWTVPSHYFEVVPLSAGKELEWGLMGSL